MYEINDDRNSSNNWIKYKTIRQEKKAWIASQGGNKITNGNSQGRCFQIMNEFAHFLGGILWNN